MQFIPFDPYIEVNGQTVYAIVDGFGAHTSVASEILLSEGIGTRDSDGHLQIDRQAWYPQDAWLRAFERVWHQIGDGALFQIGLAIPHNAKFPDWAKDVESAIRSVDVAYHMNHRKDGMELYDPVTGAMHKGIGHYGCERGNNEDGEADRLLVCVCHNPYPCAFDRGILTAVAAHFSPTVKVAHDDRAPCRKNGADSCTYLIVW